ncbi:MAG: metal-dependent transcriptional regulator [Oscillospiraceae bacterium]|nr:metal-dependent transcriptional regulator [Oscillospiraceae bacterium]
MRLQESGEMYLESILVLSLQGKSVRSIDVSEYMGYSKPSVSRAIGLLKSGGYVTVDEDGFLHLTESGRETAEKTYERHRVLSDLLVRLGVSPETASNDACKIEHALSDETFEAIKRHVALYGGEKSE